MKTGIQVHDKQSWINDNEKNIYNFYKLLLSQLEQLGLYDTHQALSLFLKRRNEKGNWNWSIFQDFINLFFNEFSGQDPTYGDGIEILRNIFQKSFDVKKRKGKKINLKEIVQTKEELDEIENSLGVVLDLAQKTENPQVFILLCGMGHVIRFERISRFVEKRIHHWASPAYPGKKDRQILIEDFITLRSKGKNGFADARHIRNSFAHGHFKFLDHETIELWDIDNDSNIAFKCKLNTGDMMNIFDMFEKKLRIAILYPEILISIENLYQIYKKDWKTVPY